MALRAINFKFDGSSSGICTPHIDGILNFYQNSRGTGFYSGIGDGGLVTAPINYGTSGVGILTFNLGLFCVYGRNVMIEQGTQLSVPLTATGSGSIGIRVNLALAAGLEVQFYSKTSQSLTQNNLFTLPTSGVFELEIYRYTANGTTLTLTRSPNLKEIKTVEERLTNLGFKEASISVINSNYIDAANSKLTQQGNVVIGQLALKIPATTNNNNVTMSDTVQVASITNINNVLSEKSLYFFRANASSSGYIDFNFLINASGLITCNRFFNGTIGNTSSRNEIIVMAYNNNEDLFYRK